MTKTQVWSLPLITIKGYGTKMSEKNTVTPEDTTAQARFVTNAQYVKDISFENPNAPQSLLPTKSAPEISLNVNVNVAQVSEDTYEVILQTNVHGEAEGKTLFLADVSYAGLFTFENTEEKAREEKLLIDCPALLFPFTRQLMATLIRDGGYPPLLINPIDFAELFHQRKEAADAPATTKH